jgi:hypothetical protein
VSKASLLASPGSRVDPPSWLTERGYLVGTLLINAALALQVAHVLRWPVYQSSARFHHLLAWAIALNLATAATLLALQPDDNPNRSQHNLWMWDWAVCLLVLAMIRALRIQDPLHMQRVFGVVWASFVFARLATLIKWVTLFGGQRWRLRRAIFCASFLVYLSITPWVAATTITNGDEPHYLLLTHSLVHDHDFDLRNNYDHQDWTPFYWTYLRDRHIITNQRGQQMPFHDVGLSILLVPGYALGNRIGAMVEINLAAAFLAAGIFEMAIELGATTAGAMACWALLAFASPLVTFAAQIYPEIPGAALSIAAILWSAKYLNVGVRSAMPVVGCLLAVMPWLSIRFWVVIGPIALVMAISLWLRLRCSNAFAREFGWLVLPTAVSVLVFCCFDLWGYGKFEPNAGYFLFLPTIGRPMFEHQIHVGLLGLFFDRSFGIWPTAPIYVVAIAGMWPAFRSRRTLSSLLLAPAIATILFTAPNHWWYGGVTPPPSRYIVVAMALLVPFAGVILAGGRSKVVVALLAIWSFVVAFEFTAFVEPRHSFWDAAKGGIVRLVHERMGVDLGKTFPALVQPERADYMLSLAWAAVVLALVVIMVWQYQVANRRPGRKLIRRPESSVGATL